MPCASRALVWPPWSTVLRFAARGRRLQQLGRLEAQPLDRGVDLRPLFRQKLLALALQQQIARACVDEHASSPLLLDELLVDELLIALQHREGIDPVFGRDVAHRREWIALVE